MTTELKLGKLPPRIDKRTIRLAAIIRKELLPPLPNSYDIDEALGGIEDSFTFNNTKYGDCVVAARAHQTLRFEKFEQGHQIEITDQEVIDQYFKESGGGDWGLILLESLKRWRKEGWPVGDQTYTIYAFASINWKNHTEVKHCIHLLNGVNFGMKVYQKDIDQFNAGEPWHLTGEDGDYLGGHGVYLHAFGYDSDGVLCMTWGKRQAMSWDFWDKRVDEAFGIVDNRNDWMAENSPVDVVKLDGQLKEITADDGEEKPGCLFWPIAIIKKGLGW